MLDLEKNIEILMKVHLKHHEKNNLKKSPSLNLNC
jgi:hypothetical protein